MTITTRLQKTISSLLLPQENSSSKKFLLYILFAYLFGMIVRLTTLVQALQIEAFWQDGNPVAIWTPDAGRYGYYAKVLLDGGDLPLSADYLTGYLVAGLSSLFSISVEWVMLILPVIIAPLIVVPMMMIAKSINQLTLGFLASLIAVSESYYYARTSLGFMDTDGVNLLLILFSLAFIVKSILEKKLSYAVTAALFLQLFSLWYHSSNIINLLIIGVSLVVVLVYYRREAAAVQLIFLLGVSVIPISFGLKLLALSLLFLLFALLNRYRKISPKIYFFVLFSSIAIVALYIGPAHYLHRAMIYLSPNIQLHYGTNGIDYSYANDLLSVSEASPSRLWDSGAPHFMTDFYLMVGIVGYILFALVYPPMLFVAPLFVLGALSAWGGIRFSMYATPALAFGATYLLYLLKELFARYLKPSRYSSRFPFYVTTLILLLMIYNILMINMSAMLKTNIYAPEAKALKAISKDLKDRDTIISWWDYGWPLWYYTGYDNTLVDNGRHGGPDSYIIARMLISSDPEYTRNTAVILGDNRLKSVDRGYKFVLPYLAEEHNLSALFSMDKRDIELSKESPSGDIYIMLHHKMLDYLGVLNSFSREKLTGGSSGSLPVVRITDLVKPFSSNHSLVEGYSYILDSSDGKVLDAKGNKTAVSAVTIVSGNKREKGYRFEHKDEETKGQVIVYQNKFIWLDQELYDSFFIQAMLFDLYDKDLFEKVAETERIKIFKIKRSGKDQ
ncbi:MAG: STT3 domain-containing protein [Campylobacterota bacterium]|nr:STT3 domain-containing protein [Campylobacterota bacterium]